MNQFDVGIVGFGNVGQELARRLSSGVIPQLRLAAISSRDNGKAAKLAETIAPDVPVVSLAEAVEKCPFIVECATGAALPEIARSSLARGRTLVCVSGGGLLELDELKALASRTGGRLRIANGALPALDILRAVSEDEVASVHLKSVIRPESLYREPYPLAAGLDFEASYPSERVFIFRGTAREAAASFPRHMNIAVSLAVAGIGLDRTTIELWADPAVPGANTTLEIKSAVADVTTVIQNVPSRANKKTSAIVVPSIVSTLRGLVDPVVSGG